MNEPKRKGLLYFSTRSYPTFGRGRKNAYDEAKPPKTVTSSPYYWWFKFLQLNEDYKATCAAGGVGKLSELYADFGDIYRSDFQIWWKDHAYLFAEPQKRHSMRIASSSAEIAPFGSDEVINLVVPLTWSQRSLKKRFAELVLSKVEKGERGVRVEGSEAKYRLSGKWHAEALSTAYKVYQARHEASDGKDFVRRDLRNGTAKNVKRFDVAWADVAIRAGLAAVRGLKEGIPTQQNVDERRMATALAMRHYKRAQQFIQSAATSRFPY